MCDPSYKTSNPGTTKIPVQDSIGTILAHDITEIRPGEFKGRAYKSGCKRGQNILQNSLELPECHGGKTRD